MSAGVTGSFGLIPFMCSSSFVFTYNNVKHSRSVRYAEHQVFGQKPVKEFVGYNSDSVSLTIQVASHLGMNPTIAVETLTLIQNSGVAYPLIIAGDYLGDFVLEGFDVDHKHYGPLGMSIFAEISLKLTESA